MLVVLNMVYGEASLGSLKCSAGFPSQWEVGFSRERKRPCTCPETCCYCVRWSPAVKTGSRNELKVLESINTIHSNQQCIWYCVHVERDCPKLTRCTKDEPSLHLSSFGEGGKRGFKRKLMSQKQRSALQIHEHQVIELKYAVLAGPVLLYRQEGTTEVMHWSFQYSCP